MAVNEKYLRKHIKEEKRIIRLLYKKGFLIREIYGLRRMYWDTDNRGYYEIHEFFRTYEGDIDSYSVVYSFVIDQSYSFEKGTRFKIETKGFNLKVRTNIIKYLKTFKTKVNDNKIKHLLKTIPK